MHDEHNGRWPATRLRPGERRCAKCGLPFRPLPHQKLQLCPLDVRLHRARRERDRKRRQRQRRRALALLYNGDRDTPP